MNIETSDTAERFAFGQNWKGFIEKSFSAERVAVAKTKLLETLQLPDLQGKTFLDVGCGSGIHSLAALQAGADKIVSFDYDPDSVATSTSLKDLVGNPPHWEIMRGSVLDRSFITALGKFDIVYSWGVLHHTGHMWDAIRNVGIPVAADGALFIALYSYTTYQDFALLGSPTPEEWLDVKERYNRSTARQKRVMEWQYVLGPRWYLPWMAAINYLRFKRSEARYIESRGMEIWTDVRDWLGGWPMEFVNELELLRFAKKELKLEIVEMICGEGNTEFVFLPENGRNWLSEVKAKRKEIPLAGPYCREGSNAWSVRLPELGHVSGEPCRPDHSSLRLLEDGEMMTYAHAKLDAIREFGVGRYCHSEEILYFSAPDNSDPNQNGRNYSVSFLP